MFFIWFGIVNLKLNFIYLNNLFTGLSILDVQFFGWFASGALACLYYKDRSKIDLIYSVIIGAMPTLVYRRDIANLGLMFILLTIFISAVNFDKFKDICDNRFLVFFGFISYPLYLIHESIMIALIIKLVTNFRFIPQVLLPIIPIVFFVSHFVFNCKIN
jgi:peptidoglycan/LPS O-acetylase OafA/YrhL